MNFDQLGPAWRTENEAGVEQTPTERNRLERYVATTRATERFWAKVLARDLVETAACLFVLCAFMAMLWALKSPVSQVGAVVVLASTVFVLYRLHRGRILRPAPVLDVSVREYFQADLDRIDDQIVLLRTVAWWYVSPLLFGVNLVFAGEAGLNLGSLTYLFVTVLMGWGIYVLNQYAVRTQVQPLRDEIAELLAQLDDPDESSVGRQEA